MKHVMLAFVSPVNARYLREPITYPNVMGEPYTSIQTNESALVYIERMLGRDQLSRIFLIASDKVRNELVPQPNEFGELNHLDFLQRRVIKECPELDGKFSVLDYSDAVDESAKLDKNILQIADIADAIEVSGRRDGRDHIFRSQRSDRVSSDGDSKNVFADQRRR